MFTPTLASVDISIILREMSAELPMFFDMMCDIAVCTSKFMYYLKIFEVRSRLDSTTNTSHHVIILKMFTPTLASVGISIRPGEMSAELPMFFDMMRDIEVCTSKFTYYLKIFEARSRCSESLQFVTNV